MKVKTYEGAIVPEGATHLSTSVPEGYFYKFTGKDAYFFLNQEWKRSNACGVYIKDNLTELPEQEAEWVPSVGEECEVNIGATDLFEVAAIKYISKQIVISSVGGHEFSSQASITKFRPLRTEAEKKREAFIEKAFRGINIDAKHSGILNEILDKLFDAVFTTPK